MFSEQRQEDLMVIWPHSSPKTGQISRAVRWRAWSEITFRMLRFTGILHHGAMEHFN